MAPCIIPPCVHKCSAGLTLLELLIALFVLSILLGVALPDFRDLVQNKRSDASVRTLLTAIELARTGAIVNNSLVTLCPSDEGEECSGNWEDGVLLFVDYDGDRKIDGADYILRYFEFPHLEGKLYWRAFQNRKYLQITPQGFTRYQNGNFTFCPNDGDLRHARQIILNRNARARQAVDSDGDDIREDSKGQPIRCP